MFSILGNATLGHMATSHARRTAELWLREDGSTAHLCVFDPATGKLQKPCTGTPQGLAADSTWARGQGWAIYGWTLAYRYTQDGSFLPFAEKAAAFYLSAARPCTPSPMRTVSHAHCLPCALSPSPKPTARLVLCGAHSIRATGQSRVTLSLRQGLF